MAAQAGKDLLLKLDDGFDWLELNQIAVFHGDRISLNG